MTFLIVTLCKFTDIGSACITRCDPGPSHAPAPVLVPAWARVRRPYLAAFLHGPVILASAAHADLLLAVVSVCDPELPGVPVVERLGLTSERLRFPFAVTASSGRLADPAGMA